MLWASGCSTRTAPDNSAQPPQAWLEPGVRVTLPPPGISPSINSQQLLTGTVQGKQQSLMVLLNADDKRIALAGLSSLGIRLFLLSYDAQGIKTEQSITLPQMPPASQVLADIMLSHWPLALWRERLPDGWTLQDLADRRELRNPQGKLVYDIRYIERNGQREPIHITQYAFKYQIGIQYLGN
ncbi:MAG: DUF3261 domain-containing protein [Enterobacteriaceae bacterium]